MKVALTAGHTLRGKGTGAVGYINESKENRELSRLVKKWLEKGGATVYYGEVDESSDYLQKQVAIANKQKVDVAVQIHFNAHKTTSSPMGTETLYCSPNGKVYADRVNGKLDDLFKPRGSKKRDNLYWLNQTNAPSILIEVCFVDSKADVDIYNVNKDRVAKKIAEGILNKVIEDKQEKVLYRVCVGSYGVRANAENQMKELKDKGIDSFLIIENQEA